MEKISWCGLQLKWVELRILVSHSVVSDSWQPHGLQHARVPCPSPTCRACSNSCPSSWWCQNFGSWLHKMKGCDKQVTDFKTIEIHAKYFLVYKPVCVCIHTHLLIFVFIIWYLVLNRNQVIYYMRDRYY